MKKLRTKTHRDGSVSYWYDHGGKPRHWEALGKDEGKALERYQALIAAPKSPAGSVDQMLKDTIENARQRRTAKAGTLRNYESYRKHLAAVFRDPFAVTQADVLRYLRECPRMSFRNEIGLLSLGYVHWMDRGVLTFNPCFGVRIRRKHSKRTRLLTQSELGAIIGAADERLAVAIELDYAIGLRIGDLCALHWADLAGVFQTQKTGARAEIEGSDALEPILVRARVLQARVASLYVLCDRRGRPWKTGTLRKRFKAVAIAAGVPDAIPHDIRAAGATAIEKLYGIETAREFLTHKSITTTIRYIRGLRPQVIRPLARKA